MAANCIAELVAAIAALSPEKRIEIQQIERRFRAEHAGERVYVARAPTLV